MTVTKGAVAADELDAQWPEMTRNSAFVVNVNRGPSAGADIILPVVKEQVTTIENHGDVTLAQTCMMDFTHTGLKAAAVTSQRGRAMPPTEHERIVVDLTGGFDFTVTAPFTTIPLLVGRTH